MDPVHSEISIFKLPSYSSLYLMIDLVLLHSNSFI